ncbi:molybdopterin molybdotransferase MoeA [Nesterenkonia jeotgali]|uniref:Molybdopterin molybdenumtransferase n=1 Tax=Nesterenkonia jeotgali TaxID=317018 RepID=A0A839FP01_9MICC|nr:gephyrin-like molybdotransferase Glp [Nesterenkonia jeotgali]MBA8921229.1 molybdopterin molybdotransferase [Nesterenkonia jeotgali]
MSESTVRAPVEEHISRLKEVLGAALGARATETLEISSGGVAGRIVAERLVSEVPLPGFDNSQMDGFALRAADLAVHEGEATLPVAGTTAAGNEPALLPLGAAFEVMTGAPIPAGADLVIPVEFTEGFGAKEVHFRGLAAADLTRGRYIRKVGSDIDAGTILAEPGDVISPAQLAVLAACGYSEVSVLERIRALVVSTGDEIRRPGSELRPGQLYDADTPLLGAVLETFGHQVETSRIGTDDPAWFLDALDALVAVHHPHLIITAGGISKGAYEVVRQGLGRRGISFGTVAQQPGGPQGWGLLEGDLEGRGLLHWRSQQEDPRAPIAVISLPGNPVSSAVSMETLVRPALAAVDPNCEPQRRVTVRTVEDISSPQGTRQFRRVRILDDATAEAGAVPSVQLEGGPGSHLLGHLARADALLELGEDDVEVPAGSEREAVLITGRGVGTR